ncbi:MAG: aminotransferase class III-fold pyridoxal phosphate-dependent enzyme [bacterium]|nr:aminotransferase class III-fold pyridoxal phosphate-dependent enzyme [bacterium]
MAEISPDDPILANLLSSEYGISGSITALAGENDNFLVVDPSGERFVLKLNGDQQSTATLELEHLAVETLAASDLDLELPRIVPTRRGTIESAHEAGEHEIRGRLLRFVAGTAWGDAGPASSALRRDLGRCLARVTSALEQAHPSGPRRTHRWDLTAAAGHRRAVARVDDAARRALLDRAFVLFSASAKPFLDEMRHSLIHGDLNDENLLVAAGRVVGLLDFGDCLVNPAVCELAIALAYALLDEPHPLEAGAEIVASYHRERPLTSRELEVLFPLICGRLAASLSIAAERRRIDPERASWFATEERAWRALERYAEIDPLTAADALSAGTGVEVFADRSLPRDEILRGRRRRFSTALSLTYAEPIAFSRGRRQFLFDERERPYLDMYNNVCHVGHCDPRVVEAGYRQMRKLNTNSRYLYDQMVEYADRLCSLLPAPLERCFFVNSGSEANELALRLARTHTGRRDMLVVDGAYHGHTNTMVEISPYKFLGDGGCGRPEEWVHVVPIADGYRGEFKGLGRETGLAYARQIEETILSLERLLAGFITESLLSCGGQVVPPEGYLEAAFAHVRNAGGVCIADEVQVGFGRVGAHFWGFELSNVVPDVVVMGKPIGNGHPMAAVITTREIADSFAAAGMEFFTTCGGNPVSCAIGTAVLDVIEDERLQQNALEVGTHLRDSLRELLGRHRLVGDVRGVGLFIGIELVLDHETLEPAPEETSVLVNQLRQRGILTGVDGPFHNVVKIKGPMVIDHDDADLFVRAVDDVLTTMSFA